MFKPNIDYADANRLEQFDGDYPEETVSCYGNLNKVLTLLNDGRSLQSIGLNFLKAERKYLYAIYQKRTQKSLEIRLYVAFNEKTQMYFILGIGSKGTQKKDIPLYQDVIEANNLKRQDR